jgi:hypothetical protein
MWPTSSCKMLTKPIPLASAHTNPSLRLYALAMCLPKSLGRKHFRILVPWRSSHLFLVGQKAFEHTIFVGWNILYTLTSTHFACLILLHTQSSVSSGFLVISSGQISLTSSSWLGEFPSFSLIDSTLFTFSPLFV